MFSLGRVNRFGIDESESFQWTLEHRGRPSCLTPGPEVIRAGGLWPGV